jgi:hypothetical protein
MIRLNEVEQEGIGSYESYGLIGKTNRMQEASALKNK